MASASDSATMRSEQSIRIVSKIMATYDCSDLSARVLLELYEEVWVTADV